MFSSASPKIVILRLRTSRTLRGAQSKDPEGFSFTHNLRTFSTTEVQARALEVEKV
ncbi:hypothetical protein HDF15_003748 [Granulicella mallensis]|uniref:Uncharacterized protein n=1 Tax=Granulicella mallensis TaxID=940614 RepID=A0A7W7ZSR4_9BACT|nr:hypothetical protein [Granulicella mallensis]